MDADFASLEAKVAQFVNLCERLRAENHGDREQLTLAAKCASCTRTLVSPMVGM